MVDGDVVVVILFWYGEFSFFLLVNRHHILLVLFTDYLYIKTGF
jgi:hypothetical protein